MRTATPTGSRRARRHERGHVARCLRCAFEDFGSRVDEAANSPSTTTARPWNVGHRPVCRAEPRRILFRRGLRGVLRDPELARPEYPRCMRKLRSSIARIPWRALLDAFDFLGRGVFALRALRAGALGLLHLLGFARVAGAAARASRSMCGPDVGPSGPRCTAGGLVVAFTVHPGLPPASFAALSGVLACAALHGRLHVWVAWTDHAAARRPASEEMAERRVGGGLQRELRGRGRRETRRWRARSGSIRNSALQVAGVVKDDRGDREDRRRRAACLVFSLVSAARIAGRGRPGLLDGVFAVSPVRCAPPGHVEHEDLAVADLAGAGGLDDRVHRPFQSASATTPRPSPWGGSRPRTRPRGRARYALLPAETLHLGHRDPVTPISESASRTSSSLNGQAGFDLLHGALLGFRAEARGYRIAPSLPKSAA